MAQETADAISIPAGGIIWAWIDALAHPEFATFQRWFPLMQVRWRRLSLAVSLFLILATACVSVAMSAFPAPRTMQDLSLATFFTYLFSSHGMAQAFYKGAGSVAVLLAMPALVTLISPRSLGPYRIRFKRVFRPWMQVQPAICALLMASALVNFVAGFVQSPSEVWGVVAFVLIAWPALRSWQLTYEALAAGSSRNVYLAGLVAAIPGLLWFFLPTILGQV